LQASYLGRLQPGEEDRRSAASRARTEELDFESKMVSGGAGQISEICVMGGLCGLSFIGRRRGAGGGAGTGKDVRRARHTMVAAARRALINFAARG
jgi:hypothetical protein